MSDNVLPLELMRFILVQLPVCGIHSLIRFILFWFLLSQIHPYNYKTIGKQCNYIDKYFFSQMWLIVLWYLSNGRLHVRMTLCGCINVSTLSIVFNFFKTRKALLTTRDIIAAGINVDKIKWDNRTKGRYRKMFLDRFGRDSQLFILYNNYKNTYNIQYLKQFNKVSLSMF